jgi:hypothetical protein
MLTIKSFVVVILTVFVVMNLIGLIVLLGFSHREDIALFHGHRYTISKTTTSYDLYENRSDHKSIILPNVRGYYAGKDKSYIRNYSELVIIDENRGTYVKKNLIEASAEELEIMDKMVEVRQ